MEYQLSVLKSFVRDSIISHPQYKEEINDLFQLCLDEIDEGGSVYNEVTLCRNDIEEIIKS
jgi:hypothetical protein